MPFVVAMANTARPAAPVPLDEMAVRSPLSGWYGSELLVSKYRPQAVVGSAPMTSRSPLCAWMSLPMTRLKMARMAAAVSAASTARPEVPLVGPTSVGRTCL